MILCARSTSRSSEQNTKRISSSEIMRNVLHGRHILGEIHGKVRKGVWASWLCFLDADWLGRQTPITWVLCDVHIMTTYLPSSPGQRRRMAPHLFQLGEYCGLMATEKASVSVTWSLVAALWGLGKNKTTCEGCFRVQCKCLRSRVVVRWNIPDVQSLHCGGRKRDHVVWLHVWDQRKCENYRPFLL